MQKHRTLKDVVEHIDELVESALTHPTLFASTPVDLEDHFRSMEHIRVFCLGIEDQSIAEYSDFIQTHKGCTSQGFTLTYLKNAKLEQTPKQDYDWELHKTFSEVWNEFIEWRAQKYKEVGITY